MVMGGPGRRAGSHRWAGCRASSFRSPSEGAGQLCDVVLGPKRADGEPEPQASLSAPGGGRVAPRVPPGRHTGRLHICELGVSAENRPS